MILRKDTIKLWLFLAALLAVWMAKDSAAHDRLAGVERSSLRSPGTHPPETLPGSTYARRFGVGQLFGGWDE